MKTIVVTGAGRGIGFETTKSLLKQGHKVLAISRNTTALLQLKHTNLLAYSFDISKDIQSATFKNFLDQCPLIDGVIHNAGKLIRKPFLELSEEDITDIYNVNVFAVIRLTQKLIPYIKKEGHFVAISSMGAMGGSVKFPELAAYSSSKAAVNILFEVLAEAFKDRQIAFNVLALGAVQTQMLNEAFPGFKAKCSPQKMGNYVANFTLEGHTLFNGKVLQVSNNTP